MKPHEIAALFGKSTSDPEVDCMLHSLGITRRPQLHRPAYPAYEVILRASSSDMLFPFSERNYWEGLPITSHGSSNTLLFTNIAITSGTPHIMRPYTGNDLPFDLHRNDDRTRARKKLAKAGWSKQLRAYKRDAWWLPNYHIRLTYQPGDIISPELPGIFDISLGITMPASTEPYPPYEYPSVDRLHGIGMI